MLVEQELSNDLKKVVISGDNKENAISHNQNDLKRAVISGDDKENSTNHNQINETKSEDPSEQTETLSESSNVCAYCKKPNPLKRCSKRHPKCLKKMFCNESCEVSGHKKKDEPVASNKKPEVKKKKKKAQGKFGGGDPVRHFAYKDYE